MTTTVRVLLSSLVLLSLCAASLTAQIATEDVVYLKSGGVMRGTILELVPERSVKLQTQDGNVFVYLMADVERIAKEPSDTSGTGEGETIESWYLCFAVGYAKPEYPGPLQRSLDAVAGMGSHAAVSLDFPGVYFPLQNRHTVIGGVLNGVGDRYEVNSQSMQINHYTLGLSVMHFVTAEIGDGLFLRGDIGIASLAVDVSGTTSTSDTGFGVLIGGGYAFPVSSETRILLNLNFASRKVEGDNYGALGINVGVML